MEVFKKSLVLYILIFMVSCSENSENLSDSRTFGYSIRTIASEVKICPPPLNCNSTIKKMDNTLYLLVKGDGGVQNIFSVKNGSLENYDFDLLRYGKPIDYHIAKNNIYILTREKPFNYTVLRLEENEKKWVRVEDFFVDGEKYYDLKMFATDKIIYLKYLGKGKEQDVVAEYNIESKKKKLYKTSCSKDDPGMGECYNNCNISIFQNTVVFKDKAYSYSNKEWGLFGGNLVEMDIINRSCRKIYLEKMCVDDAKFPPEKCYSQNIQEIITDEENLFILTSFNYVSNRLYLLKDDEFVNIFSSVRKGLRDVFFKYLGERLVSSSNKIHKIRSSSKVETLIEFSKDDRPTILYMDKEGGEIYGISKTGDLIEIDLNVKD